MSFLDGKKGTELVVYANLKPSEVAAYNADLQAVASHLSASEMHLLKRALSNPLIKMAAIAELKKRLTN